MGFSQQVMVQGGRLAMGQWQDVIFCESASSMAPAAGSSLWSLRRSTGTNNAISYVLPPEEIAMIGLGRFPGG